MQERKEKRLQSITTEQRLKSKGKGRIFKDKQGGQEEHQSRQT